MDEMTNQFVEDRDLSDLFEELHATHKPTKASLSDVKLKSIGKLVVRFQRLEHNLVEICAETHKLSHDQKLTVLGELSFKRIVGLIASGADRYPDEIKVPLKRLARLANRAEELRNRMLHSIWFMGARAKTKGGALKFETLSDDDMTALVEAVDKIDTCADAMVFAVTTHQSPERVARIDAAGVHCGG